MDIDIQSIIKNFNKRFILEDIREQVLSELNNPEKRTLFTNRLNKDWDSVVDMTFLKRLDSAAESLDLIKKEMHLENRDLCYVISNYTEIDDKVMEFNYAFGKIYGQGLGSIIVNLAGNNIYLQTGTISSVQHKFIGKR